MPFGLFGVRTSAELGRPRARFALPDPAGRRQRVAAQPRWGGPDPANPFGGVETRPSGVAGRREGECSWLLRVSGACVVGQCGGCEESDDGGCGEGEHRGGVGVAAESGDEDGAGDGGAQ